MSSNHFSAIAGRAFVILMVFVVAVMDTAAGQAPATIAYQGFLTDAAGNPIDQQNATLTFRLYDGAAGGSTLWTETHSGVSIEKGIFAVLLGADTSLDDLPLDIPLWLSVARGDENAAEMSPRAALAAVPYALRARSLADSALKAGENVVLTRDGTALEISVPTAGVAEPGWHLAGNAATDPDTNFVGTTDDVPLELRVNNRRALRLSPHTESPNLIGGYEGNTIEGNISGVTIGGGGAETDGTGSESHHTVSASFATIGGGLRNVARGTFNTVSGGWNNAANLNDAATIGGGANNTARGSGSTIGGGRNNFIDGLGADAVVAGGRNNRATRFFATVPGGIDNAATADYSFAAGRRAKANHQGAFVWGDATNEDVTSTANNQFIIRASGGVGIGTNAPGSPLTVAGVVESTTGGFRFPDGSVQTSAAADAAPAWNLSGNNNITDGTHYLGTSNEVALEIRVRNVRALRIEPINPFGIGRVAAGSANIIGGHRLNEVRRGAVGATISGGGRAGGGGGTFVNIVTEDYGTIGGGRGNFVGDDDDNPESALFPTIAGGSGNRASAFAATIGGGSGNTASGNQHATVSGGGNNTASGNQSTVGGGVSNEASGSGSAVGGGFRNKASGARATVAGGDQNEARGPTSFAAGYRARAIHEGAFVWSDRSRTADSLLSTRTHEFTAKASGGFVFYTNTTATGGVSIAPGGGSWSTLSDRNAKTDFASVDPQEVLRRMISLPVYTWRYSDEESGALHMGPTAQDFSAAFGLGDDERKIATVDADGVTIAAIQGLHQLVEEQQAEIDDLRAEIAELRSMIEGIASAGSDQGGVPPRGDNDTAHANSRKSP